jgi:hypothetical protein
MNRALAYEANGDMVNSAIDAKSFFDITQSSQNFFDIGEAETTLQGNISSAGQQDIYSFNAESGQLVTIRVNTESSGMDTVILLLNGNDEPIAFNDYFEDDNTAGFVDFELPVAGTYRLVITNYRGATLGDYELQFTLR